MMARIRTTKPKVLILYNNVDGDFSELDVDDKSIVDISKTLADGGYQVSAYNLEDEVDKVGDALVVHRPSLVFNLIQRIFGEHSLGASVAGLLDLYGYIYTGPDPLCMLSCLDRTKTLAVLKDAGIQTPKFAVIRDINAGSKIETVNPLMVTQAFDDVYDEDESRMLFTTCSQAMNRARELATDYDLPYILEEFLPGQRIQATLIGNQTLQVLPLTEQTDDPENSFKLAKLQTSIADDIRLLARRAFRACGCRDIAQVDLIFDGTNTAVTNVRPQVDLVDGPLKTAAGATAEGFCALLYGVVIHAHKRLPIHELSEHPLPRTHVSHPEGVITSTLTDHITKEYGYKESVLDDSTDDDSSQNLNSKL